MTKTLRNTACAIAIAAFFAVPASAMAGQYYVPNNNSAVNQYSESFPTAGGDQSNGRGTPTTQKHDSNQALGAENAEKLESTGAEGKAAAELATETAPEPVTEAAPEPETSNGGGESAKPKHQAAAGNGQAQHKAPTGEPAAPPKQAPSTNTKDSTLVLSAGDGASATGEVASKTFGLSSPGSFGWLLPLAIVAAAAWAGFYLGRRRRKTAA